MLRVSGRLNPSLETRVAIVLVRRSSGLYFVHRRHPDKKTFPGLFGVGVGGKAEADESFKQAAVRELSEELNINAPLQYLFHFVYLPQPLPYEGAVYLAIHDGVVQPSESEFDAWDWREPESILKEMQQGTYCPDTKVFFQRTMGLM